MLEPYFYKIVFENSKNLFKKFQKNVYDYSAGMKYK